MTTTEHLLTCLSEECAEIQQAVSKALRFGLDDSHPKTGSVRNLELIRREIDDLFGVIELLDGVLAFCTPLATRDHARIQAKKSKVEEWMKYAREKGTLV